MMRPSPSQLDAPAVELVIDRVSPALRSLTSFPARALLGLIWIYQRAVSPVLPVVFGSACGCRFAPTCSHYAADAVRTHGALIGTWLALRRLIKCTPLHPGGIDPVPPRRLPACVRATNTSPTHPSSQLTA